MFTTILSRNDWIAGKFSKMGHTLPCPALWGPWDSKVRSSRSWEMSLEKSQGEGGFRGQDRTGAGQEEAKYHSRLIRTE